LSESGSAHGNVSREAIDRIGEKLGFSGEDLHRFLKKSAWDKYKCEVCSKDNFLLSILDGKPLAFSLELPGATGMGYWVIVIQCSDCGNIKSLNPTFVRDWLRAESSED
jgi:hypothetical protein